MSNDYEYHVGDYKNGLALFCVPKGFKGKEKWNSIILFKDKRHGVVKTPYFDPDRDSDALIQFTKFEIIKGGSTNG